MVASDSSVWIERDPDTVAEPDVAFTSAKKIPLDAEIDGYAEVVPDLVVEIVSPSDSRRWARDRAQMWLDYGAPLVWLVHPDTRTIDVYRPAQPQQLSARKTHSTAKTSSPASPAKSAPSSLDARNDPAESLHQGPLRLELRVGP